jgi:hypothetical protein
MHPSPSSSPVRKKPATLCLQGTPSSPSCPSERPPACVTPLGLAEKILRTSELLKCFRSDPVIPTIQSREVPAPKSPAEPEYIVVDDDDDVCLVKRGPHEGPRLSFANKKPRGSGAWKKALEPV